MEYHASVTRWQKMFFLTFSGRSNRYFWDIRLKILMLPNFNMLFQLVPTEFFKSELFSRLPQVDHVTTVVKETEREGRAREENGLLSDGIFDCALGYRVFSSFWSGIKTHKAKPSIVVVILETHFAEEEAFAKSSSV